MNPNSVSWELAASLADDPGLFAEIQATVVSDVNNLVDLLNRARCDANWLSAATRLRNLSASFGMEELKEGAELAIAYAPRDPVALRSVNRAAEAFIRMN